MPLKIHTAAPFYAMGIAFLVVSLAVNLWKRFGPTFLINGTPSEPVGFCRLVPRPESAY
jgi:hypothetical protein